jgi:hypothetical protein
MTRNIKEGTGRRTVQGAKPGKEVMLYYLNT